MYLPVSCINYVCTIQSPQIDRDVAYDFVSMSVALDPSHSLVQFTILSTLSQLKEFAFSRYIVLHVHTVRGKKESQEGNICMRTLCTVTCTGCN